MEKRKKQRFWGSIVMMGLMLSQLTTGVFPIPIAPVQKASAIAATKSFGPDAPAQYFASNNSIDWNVEKCYANLFHQYGGGKYCDGSNMKYHDGGVSVKQFCKENGYNTATVTSTASWHSPADDTLLYWNGSKWVTQKGSDSNKWIERFSCSDPITSCNDGIDNDNDGRTDYPADPGCSDPNDDTEDSEKECNDGIDNDNDGKVDYPEDLGCSSATDDDESNDPQCADGVDNDNDGRTDYPNDPGCSDPTDNTEDSEKECNDGIDNDNDGKVDYPEDLGCSSPTDNDESNDPQCADGVDNDNDGRVDYPEDPGCSSPSDDSENSERECNDGIDNDNDGRTDYPNDPGCSSPTDNSEDSEPECSDNIDNDNDGRTDYPNDPGCSSPTDDSENSERQCNDGIDNDNDGRTDYPNDPGCTSPTDNSEDSEPECSDNIDNDNDGQIDYPNDAGCSSPTDNDEGDEPLPQCNDGIDNDNDGKVDYPADPGCSSPTDDDESGDTQPECSDGIDNDNDGYKDAQDPGCHTDGKANNPSSYDPNDNNESDNTPECRDGIDNDNDGQIDYPNDAGCSSSNDDNEGDDPQPECSDGIDNDNDGYKDAQDPGCHTDGKANNSGSYDPNDDSEFDNIPECRDGIDNDHDGKTDYPNDVDCTSADDDDESPTGGSGFYIKKERDDAPANQPVAPGDTIRYKITIKNNDTKTANARIIDIVPNGLEFVSGSFGCAFYAGTGGGDDQVICAQQPLPVGDSRNVKLTFRVKSNVQSCTTIENQADVWNDDANYPTGIPPSWSNVIETPTVCDNPELDVTKTVTQPHSGSVKPGDALNYRIDVKNVGTGVAHNVQVSDTIPSGLIFNSGGSTNSCSQSSNTIVCSVGDINANSTASVTIAFTVDPNISSSDNRCGGYIVNQASAAGSNTSTDVSNSVSTLLECPAPSFTATKTVNVSHAEVGDTVTYGIAVKNTGSVPLSGVWVIDTIPAGLTFNDNASDSRCFQQGNDVKCGDTTINPGHTDTYTLVFTVNNSAQCNADIANSAYVVFMGNGNLDGYTNTVHTTVDCQNPNFKATKTASTDTVEVGDTFHYTITLQNTGNVELGGTWITDEIPDNLSFVYGNPSDHDCFPQGNVVKCGDEPIGVGQSDSYDLYFTVDNTAQCGEIIDNVADVTFIGNNISGSTNHEQVKVICPEAKLKVTKQANRSTADIGDIILYTLTVENISSTDAVDVQVYDSVISELQFRSNQSSNSCTVSGGQIICGPTDIPAGSSKQFTLAFEVTNQAACDSTIYNQAEADAANAPSVLSNSEDVDIVCAQKEADLEIHKTGPSQILRGTTIVYSVKVKNNGPDTAENVQVTDAIPHVLIQDTQNYTDLVFNSSQSDNACYKSGNSVICDGFNLASGQVKILQLAFDVPGNANCAKPIINDVEVWSSTHDPITSNNQDEHISTVNCATETLDIHKSVDKATAKAGDIITYTITVENNIGFNTTLNRVIDLIPTGLEYVSADSNLCFHDVPGNEIICGEFDLASGATKEFKLKFRVKNTAECNENIINIADVWSRHPGVDPQWSNAVTTKILCDAVLTIQKTDNRTTAKAGDTLNYDILVSNISNADAKNVTIVDDLPNNVTFVSANAGGTYNAQAHTVTWNIDVDAQDNASLEVHATVKNSASGGDVIYNNVCIQNGDCDDDTTTIEDDLKFTITKTDNRSTVHRGETLTYDIDIENISSVDGHNVEIIDTLPQYVTYLSSTNGGSFSNGKVTWHDNIDAGDSLHLEVTVSVDNNAPDGFYLYNYVEITGGPDDDDTTKVVVDPEILGCIDVQKETFNPNGSVLTPVTQFTFHLDGGTQTVQNDSSGNARFINVPAGTHTVTEVVPSGWTQFNVTPSGGTVTVPEGSNCATVTFKNRQNGSTGSANFTISKTDNRTEADPGERLTYEITVRNTGSADATDVEVTDNVPNDTSYVSASDGASRSGDRVTWTFDLAAGASKTLTMRVEIDDNVYDGDTIYNTACITGGPCDDDQTDITGDNNYSGDLNVNINDDPDPVDVCDDDELEYEIRITNPNNSNEETDVVALLDSNTDYRSSSNGGRERSGDRVEWNNVKISRNSDKTLRLRVRVNNGTRDGDTLRLRVGLSNGDDDTEITRVRNRNCGYNPPTGTPDLSIDKTADVTEALAGSLISYTVTIRNISTEDVPNAVLTDDYPENYITISDPGGGSDAGGRITWNLGTLRANSTTVVRYRARVRTDVPRGTSIRNTATVRSGTITRTDDHVIVVPTPPQTGLGGFIKSLTRSDTFLSNSDSSADAVVAAIPESDDTMIDAVPATTGAASLPVLVWITTMLTGLGMGGVFGKKFLF